MKVYDAPSIRNVALVGHSGAGKTQLVSALLFDAGAVNRLGRVDDGTTVTDYDEEEIARKHTLSCSLAYARVEQAQDQLHRHAGHGQFPERRARGAARRGRRAGGRRRGRTASRSRPRRSGRRPRSSSCRASSSLNRLDRERASLDRSLESLRGGVRPHGRADPAADRRRAEASRGVVDLVVDEGVDVRDRRQRQADGGGRSRRHARAPAQAAREALIEMVAEADDALMEKFFDAGTLTQEELRRRA